MFFTFEISTPFRAKPGFYRCPGVTSFRVWWLWFAVSLHPMRFDQMLKAAQESMVEWK